MTETKKEAFRRYLESAGAIDTLTKVLVNLYEEPGVAPLCESGVKRSACMCICLRYLRHGHSNWYLLDAVCRNETHTMCVFPKHGQGVDADRPLKANDYIKKALGSPTPEEYEKVVAENKRLQAELEAAREQLAELQTTSAQEATEPVEATE